MLEAMQASSDSAPALRASSSTSRCTSGEIVAQLMKNFPRAFTSRLSSGAAKISRIAASSETTVMITSAPRSLRLTIDWQSCRFPARASWQRAVRVINGRDVKTLILQAARHVRAHSADSDKGDVHGER